MLEGWAAAEAVGRMPRDEIEALRACCEPAYARLRETGEGDLVARLDEDMHEGILEERATTGR